MHKPKDRNYEGVDLKNWETQFVSEQRWWVPYTNKLEVIRGPLKLPKKVKIFEQTLREGSLAPGRKDLSVVDRLRIMRALEAAGVTEAEAGSWSYGPEAERAAITQAKKEGIKIEFAMHTAAWVQDFRAEIDKIVEAGVGRVNLLQYGCSHELANIPWLKMEDVPERGAQCVAYCKKLGVKAAFGLTATGRAYPPFEEDCYQAAAEAGADRIYVYDGFGVMIPEVVSYCVRHIRDIIGSAPEIAVHCHNDMGLATANTIAAIQAGATVADASINGLGNRAGIGALEEIVSALTVLYGVETGIDMEKLTALSALVEEVFGIPVSYNKAVVGRNMYWHESDVHNSHIFAGHWYAWNVIKPETIGRKNVINIVPQCLHKQPQGTIPMKIRQMGLKATDVEL
ncbi:MAG: LeuA family protein, partial [Saprospiraceae bacterium]|nr:LeuA family protein [Saprospiraceae bacterium]